MQQDDWHTCFSESCDIYIDTGFLDDDDDDGELAGYIVFQWSDLVKMIQIVQDDPFDDGILLESRLGVRNPLDAYEMEIWLQYWAAVYLRAGRIYDLSIASKHSC